MGQSFQLCIPTMIPDTEKLLMRHCLVLWYSLEALHLVCKLFILFHVKFNYYLQSALKVKKKAKIRKWEIQVPHLTQDIVWESDKTQQNSKYMRAKRSAISQQVTTRLKDTDKITWRRQILIKRSTKKYRLGPASRKILKGFLFVWFVPLLPSPQSLSYVGTGLPVLHQY